MRKIIIEFEVPEDIEDVYGDVAPELVFEDLFSSQIGFRVVGDTAQQSVQRTACTRDHDLRDNPYICDGCGQLIGRRR